MEKEGISNSGLRLGKKRQKLELAKRPPQSAVAASRFMSMVPDSVLVEILVRLPDYRTVIHCGLVCKRWSSLIFHSENHFNHHHLRLGPFYEPLPYTLYLIGGYNSRPNRRSKQISFLGFRNPIIRCSFQDLFLLQTSRTQYCICNPFTKQVVNLPETPLLLKLNQFSRGGFACKPNSSCCLQPSSYCNCSIKYKVVLITPDKEDGLLYRMVILSSETGQWKELRFSFPLREEAHSWYDAAVACNNGILYWQVENSNSIRRILAFDLFMETAVETERFRLISYPAGFNLESYQECGKERLGVVRGRLRLSQSFWHSDDLRTFYLKAWELNDEEEDGWVLVHDVVVKMEEQAMMYLIGLHPDDDVFFFFRHGIYCGVTHAFKKAGALYKYKIGRDSFEKGGNTKQRQQWSGHYIEFFTLVRLWLPTKIPALPCPNN